MRAAPLLALSAFFLSWGTAQAYAQGSAPPGAHSPISIVDERDRLQLFGPPDYPPQPHQVGPNHTITLASLSVGDGWPEEFKFVEPLPPPTQPVPLVVMFHKFGSTQNDLTANTNFPNEAGHQGWYLVCPLAANTQHFGSLASQVHMEAVILDMLARFPLIDRNRIYAIGFSMGAGAAANYAARHVNPMKPMIAAMITMSGGFDLNHVYYSDIPARDFLDFWYGSGGAIPGIPGVPGSAHPWKMARSSTIKFDPITYQVDTTQNLARNLTHIPLQIVRPRDDPVPYLPKQCDVMAAHMQTLGMVPGPNFDYQFVPFGWDAFDHRWSMLNSHWGFDWLGTHTLTLPTSANTLADRDDVYFHFYVEQDAPGAFTPFQWQLDTPNNALHVSGTANLRRLTVDTLGAGLDPLLPLSVDLSTADSFADEVVFTSVPASPTNVLRDGNACVSWTYSSSAQELTLIETDGLQHVWSVLP